MAEFEATLFRLEMPGSWTFVSVPPEHAPSPSEPWGRSPVRATVDGRAWDTSVWADRKRGALLPVPARIRRGKGDGDVVRVTITPRWDRE